MAQAPRPTVLLYEQLFSEEQHAQDAGLLSLKTYLAEGGSIFPLVQKGAPGLVREYGLSVEDAQRFLRRANSMATYVRRQFIEHTLVSDQSAQDDPSSGLLSMVEGPKYEDIFRTAFENMSPPDALESCISPVAYLIDLLVWIRDRIEPEGNKDQIPLRQRRTDLMELSVDFNAVYQSVSSVDIITAVLEDFIVANDAQIDIEKALMTSRYPNGLPYYQHWVTIDGIAQLKGLSVGDFNDTVDLSYPYFLNGASAVRPVQALAHASRLGPYQRALLTEDMLGDDEDWKQFYLVNFGVTGVGSKTLHHVPYFATQTKLDTLTLESLLSVKAFAPVRSANVTYGSPETTQGPESGRSGSVYINANSHPGVSITTDITSTLNILSVDPENVKERGAFDRMNRKIRLDNWLQLPSDQVDALLAAAMRAEERGNPGVAGKWLISDNVVHALGLFQILRQHYKCTATDFAVFLDCMSIYGRGEAVSQFDQVFNAQANYRQPMKLDKGNFPVVPQPGPDDMTISQLCAGLRIDLQTYQYLAVAVARAHNITNNTLQRSLPIISSFYRLVWLPRWLRMTPLEGLLMLQSLGGDDWVNGLAGEPSIKSAAGATADVLTLMSAMDACVLWCKRSDLSVMWVMQHAVELSPGREASERDLALFEQLRSLLPNALFSNAGLLMAGLPPAGAADWLDFLTQSVVPRPDGIGETLGPIVDASGLVLAPAGTPDEYLIFARKRLGWAVDNALGATWASQRDAMVGIMLNVVLEARDAQVSVVKETLAVYAGVAVELAIPIINWAGTTVFRLLEQLTQRIGLAADTREQRRTPETDPVIDLLADVRRRSEVVSTLELSAALLQDYLDYGHLAWLGQTDKYAISVNTLYYLSVFKRAFALSEQPQHKLLDYLRQVNALPTLSVDARTLAYQASTIKLAEYFGWSVQEVRDCVSRIDPVLPILKSLKQLDLLMRVRVMSTATDMDALTLFLLGTLPATVDDGESQKAYADAAERALLSETGEQVPRVEMAEDLQQLVTTTCIVTPTELIAGKPGEKAIFTVTVKNPAGLPLEGVPVYWKVALGTLQKSITDKDGTLKAEYFPGTTMGAETPMYWLDLLDPEYAPTINIVAEAKSMEFPLFYRSTVPSTVVPRGQEVELYVTMMDRYGNLGQDMLVEWFATPVNSSTLPLAIVRPSQAFTNQEGFTRVFVSSATGGTFVCSVLSHGSEERANFDLITFEGDQVTE
ncbi:Tc toxin subunit A [Pseudomonas sp. NPDC098747]|uniref:Tc toxin subunit A n=1 Tax=Pseudomonas sp. NPDC098747 TaxID=3364487 RepID=UPI00383A62C5